VKFFTALVAAAGVLAFAAGAFGSEGRWMTFVEPELGTRVQVPSYIFQAEEGASPKGSGRVLRSDNGRAVLGIYSLHNSDRDTPASYVRKNYKAPEAAIDYKRVSTTFFAISGVYHNDIYYSRCNFSRAAGGAIHCIDLKYPASEKRAWDPIVTRISLSLRPLEASR
jgi:hypothetical protein